MNLGKLPTRSVPMLVMMQETKYDPFEDEAVVFAVQGLHQAGLPS